MAIGMSKNTPGHKLYLQEVLKEAQITIAKFRIIDKFTNGFSHFSGMHDFSNEILFIARSATNDLWIGKPNIQAYNYLKYIEDSLITFDAQNWKRDRLNQLKSRLSSADIEVSKSVILELLTGLALVKKYNISNVKLNPILSNGKEGDILLDTKEKYYIECCSIEKGIVEKTIEKIFDSISDEVANKIPDDKIAQVNVDTSKLIFEDVYSEQTKKMVKRINEIKSREKILDFLYRFKILPVLDIDCAVHLAYLSGLSGDNVTIYDKKENLKYEDEFLFNKADIEPVSSFLRSTKIREIIDCPITYFRSGPANWKHVELHSEDNYPSPSAEAELESFKEQLARKIKFKYEEKKQFEPDHKNILLIQGFNWVTWGYTRKGELADYHMLIPFLEDFLLCNKIEDLSAIYIFEQDMKNGRVILNPNCKGVCKVTEDEVLNLFN